MPSAHESAPEIERLDPYLIWRAKENVCLTDGVFLRDMRHQDVADWPRKGVKGALCYMEGDQETDEHLVEIPPGGATLPERHLYDEVFYVLAGRGTCTVWWEETRKQTFEWGEGSFFALPTNINYQFFNASGREAARYFSVTNMPEMMRQFHSEEFVFNCPVAFSDRYSGEKDYFNGDGKLYRGRLWETNFIPDVRRLRLYEYKQRGGGGTNANFMLAGGEIGGHISRFQVGTYKKGHRHGPHAHLYICEGEGYSLVQRGADEEMIRCDWQEGSMFLSGAGPGMWWHQHFNVGSAPAAYLVLGVSKSRRYATSRWNAEESSAQLGGGAQDLKEGGRQIGYDEEAPFVHKLFEEELAKRGVVCRMRNLSPNCTGIEGPTSKGEWGDEH